MPKGCVTSLSNFESLDVYVSWDDPHGRVARKADNFLRLWHNHTPRLTVLDFTEAAKRQLLRFRPSLCPAVDPVPRQDATNPVITRIPDIPTDMNSASIKLKPVRHG